MSIYFEARLQATRQKLEGLKQVASPILQRAYEELRKKPDAGLRALTVRVAPVLCFKLSI